jgi:hypothetical protein
MGSASRCVESRAKAAAAALHTQRAARRLAGPVSIEMLSYVAIRANTTTTSLQVLDLGQVVAGEENAEV